MAPASASSPTTVTTERSLDVSETSPSSLATSAPGTGKLKLLLAVVPYVALYVFAIWLVALTDDNADPVRIRMLWQWFIPAVGLIAIGGGWQGMKTSAGGLRPYLIRQVLHWVATLVVIHLLFGETLQAFLTTEVHGFVAIYVLGLSAILAGIHMDWKMALFGLFLVGSGVGIAFLNDNAMLLTLIGIAVVGVGISSAFLWRTRHA
jgi:hypothetical protein